jgi:uncharacterized protein (DUF488 family)
VRIFTIGHGARPLDELLACLREAGAGTVVDVRRYPGSRRLPHFSREPLERALEQAGIGYVHAVELGGRLGDEPGEERFPCIRVAAFRSYAARMGTAAWLEALAASLEHPSPAFMCAETPWWRCHRRLISELLWARGLEVVHLVAPGERQPHRPWEHAEARDGRLFLCGAEVA